MGIDHLEARKTTTPVSMLADTCCGIYTPMHPHIAQYLPTWLLTNLEVKLIIPSVLLLNSQH